MVFFGKLVTAMVTPYNKTVYIAAGVFDCRNVWAILRQPQHRFQQQINPGTSGNIIENYRQVAAGCDCRKMTLWAPAGLSAWLRTWWGGRCAG